MLNKAILVGRLTADPELKQTPNGISVTSFSIAINIVAWRSQAEFIAKYFRKGNMIGIDGSIQTRNYEDKSGNKRTAFEVVADAVSFVESKNSASGGSSGSSAPSESTGNVPYASGNAGDFQTIDSDDDDLPF